jgi:hypothetical protein
VSRVNIYEQTVHNSPIDGDRAEQCFFNSDLMFICSALAIAIMTRYSKSHGRDAVSQCGLDCTAARESYFGRSRLINIIIGADSTLTTYPKHHHQG